MMRDITLLVDVKLMNRKHHWQGILTLPREQFTRLWARLRQHGTSSQGDPASLQQPGIATFGSFNYGPLKIRVENVFNNQWLS